MIKITSLATLDNPVTQVKSTIKLSGPEAWRTSVPSGLCVVLGVQHLSFEAQFINL